MSIKRTIITTIVVLALVAVVAPAVTSADTISDLLAQIAQLQAQLRGLQQSSMTQSIGNCTGVTFTRNLMVGSTGSDVKCLQTLLNLSSTTQVAITGAGSPGSETSYFGSLTLSAVRKYQTQHGWTPANQAGPLTRAALNATLGTYTGGTNPPPVVTPTGAGLQVLLAADNPASGTIVVGSALTPLAKYVFVNGDNAAVKVTQLKVTRIGVSADTDLQNVYLLQGATRLTDSATVSSGLISFNDPTGLFTVPAGSSVEITVAADILGYGATTSEASAGETVGIALTAASNITTNASSVRGNFPINGNLMTTAGTYQTLATVAFGTSTTPAGVVTVNPQNNYPIWQNTVTVGTRTVSLTRIAFRLIGSVQASDLQNFKLNIDGTQAGSTVASVDKNGYVTFDLSSSPLVLQATGHTVKLMADIVNGSSHNFTVGIRVQADANFVDSSYGATVQPYVSAQGTWTLADVTTALQTIASGTITISKAINSPSGNVVLGASNQPIADYTLTAAGEPIKITDMYFYIYDGTAVKYFRNGALYANGVQVGSTTSIPSTGTSSYDSTAAAHFSLGSALVVTPGSPVTLELRADIHEVSSTAVANGDSIYAELLGTSTYFTAQDMFSLATPTAPSSIPGNTLTVAQGTLSLAKYGAYTNQTIVPPQTNYMLGHFTLTSSTTEPTNLNTIYVDLANNTTTITNLYVKYGTQQTTAISTVTAQGTTLGTTLPANSYNISYTLPAGQTIDLEVFGDINNLASGSGARAISTYIRVDGMTANSIVTVHSNGIAVDTAGCSVQGQTITIGAGSFVVAQDSGTPLAQALAGGSPVTAGIFQITAQNDSYTINELKFALGSVTSAGASAAMGAITSVALKDNATGATLATASPGALLANTGQTQYVAYFTGLGIPMPAGTIKSLAVVLNLSSTLSADTGTTNIDVEPTLTYVKASNSSGTPYCDPVATGCTSATAAMLPTYPTVVNATYVFKSVPSIVFAGADSKATNGNKVELYKTAVTATGGAVKVKQMKFYVTVSSPTLNAAANGYTYLDNFTFLKNNSDITTSVKILNLTATAGWVAGSNLKTTTTIDTNTVVVVFSSEDSIAAGSTATYQLKANVHNFQPGISTYAGDSVTTYMPYNATWDGTATTAYSATTGSGAQLAALTDSGTTQMFYVAPGVAASGPNTFIWSDNSAGLNGGTMHATTAAGSADWYNTYLILTSSTPTETVGAQ